MHIDHGHDIVCYGYDVDTIFQRRHARDTSDIWNTILIQLL